MPPFKPKVLFVGAFPPVGRRIFGGNVTACRALMDSSFPHMVELILIDTTQLSNPAPPFLLRLLLSIKRFINFVITLEKERPHAILVFAASGASMIEKSAMCWYAKFRGVGSLIFPRDGRILEYAKRPFLITILPYIFAGATKVLCQGPAWKKFGTEILKRSDYDTPIISNWTATDELLNIGEGRVFVANNEKVRFLFVGWLEDHKGVFELLGAVKTLISSRDFTLDLVGSGNSLDSAKDFIEKNSLQDVVRLRGWLNSDELLKMYANSDVFVLPSWFEGLPNSLIEAMAAKMAIVTTKVGAIPDYLCNDEHGILISPKNEAELTNAMLDLLENPEKIKLYACNAYSLARDEWSVEIASRKLLECLEV